MDSRKLLLSGTAYFSKLILYQSKNLCYFASLRVDGCPQVLRCEMLAVDGFRRVKARPKKYWEEMIR